MKTPEEVASIFGFSPDNIAAVDAAKRIQLDAWRQGMTDAAELCSTKSFDCEAVILAARDAKEKPNERNKQ